VGEKLQYCIPPPDKYVVNIAQDEKALGITIAMITIE